MLDKKKKIAMLNAMLEEEDVDEKRSAFKSNEISRASSSSVPGPLHWQQSARVCMVCKHAIQRERALL